MRLYNLSIICVAWHMYTRRGLMWSEHRMMGLWSILVGNQIRSQTRHIACSAVVSNLRMRC